MTSTEDTTGNSKYDLEERTFAFAKEVREFVDELPKSVITIEDGKQLVRASGSVGANYVEANEAVSKKDFHHRIKVARKEAKESKYWLRLLESKSSDTETSRKELIKEATELMEVFSSILISSQDDSN